MNGRDTGSVKTRCTCIIRIHVIHKSNSNECLLKYIHNQCIIIDAEVVGERTRQRVLTLRSKDVSAIVNRTMPTYPLWHASWGF